tara:strand:+ start:1044 stop:1853 length:810 start_codon:yes stop_codon:yes gene_type:complete
MGYPSPRQALVLSFLFVAIQIVLGSLGFPYSERLALIVTECTLVLLLALFLGRSSFSTEDALLLNATTVSTILASAVAAIGAALLVAELDIYVSELLDDLQSSLPVSRQRYVIGIQLVDSASDALVVFATLILAPAVCEELFFRGFVFTVLAAHHGAAAAILGSAFLFAAIHFNPWQFPALVLLGIFLGVLVYITHSIYPAILAHMMTNGLSVVGVNLRAHTGQDMLAASDHLPMAVLLGAVVLLWSGLRIVQRQNPAMPLLRRDTGEV